MRIDFLTKRGALKDFSAELIALLRERVAELRPLRKGTDVPAKVLDRCLLFAARHGFLAYGDIMQQLDSTLELFERHQKANAIVAELKDDRFVYVTRLKQFRVKMPTYDSFTDDEVSGIDEPQQKGKAAPTSRELSDKWALILLKMTKHGDFVPLSLLRKVQELGMFGPYSNDAKVRAVVFRAMQDP